MSCCGDVVYCLSCGDPLTGAELQAESAAPGGVRFCFGCQPALPLVVRVEDPDERPYTWDLED